MSEPTFENSKKKLERHLMKLMSQPIREFQSDFEVIIQSIEIGLIKIDEVAKVDNITVNLKK